MSYNPNHSPFPNRRDTDHFNDDLDFGGGFSDGSFGSLGSYSPDDNNDGSFSSTGSFQPSDSFSESNPLLSNPEFASSDSVNPLLNHRDTSSDSVNPLLTNSYFPSGSAYSSGISSSGSAPFSEPSSYGKPISSSSGPSEPDNNPFASYHINDPYNRTSSAEPESHINSYQNKEEDNRVFTKEQSFHSPSDNNPVPPVSSSFSVDDFEPSEKDIKKKRNDKISNVIASLAFIGFVSILWLSFSSLIRSNDRFVTIFYCAIGVLILLFLIQLVSLIRFLKNKTDKKYYRAEAIQAVRRANFDEKLRRFQASREISSSPVNSTVSHNRTSNNLRRTIKPQTPEQMIHAARILIIISILLIIITTLLGGGAVLKRISNNKALENKITVDAHVTSVRVVKTTKRHKKHTYTDYQYYYMLEYAYNDTLYERGEFYSSGKINEGDYIQAYIDPNNPGDCVIKIEGNLFNDLLIVILFCVPEIVVLITGINYMIKGKKKQKEQRLSGIYS